jgi:hypothetical protein
VPPKPKEFTEALRSPVFPTGQATCSVGKTRFQASASILGLIRSNHMLAGIMPLSSTRTVLMSPANPLAPSRWPTLDLTAPTYSGSRVESRNASAIALLKVGIRSQCWSRVQLVHRRYVRFSRITNRSTCAMRFKISGRGHVETGFPIRGSN